MTPLRENLMLYLMTILIFFAIDMVWLGAVASQFYQVQLGHLLADEVFWPPAIAFYLLFISGLLIFAVRPAVQQATASYAVKHGGLFGLFTYATYDLTNYATLPGWPLIVVVVDIIWGMVLCGTVAGLASWLWLRFIRPQAKSRPA
jgi:uncharacterized membrane protein